MHKKCHVFQEEVLCPTVPHNYAQNLHELRFSHQYPLHAQLAHLQVDNVQKYQSLPSLVYFIWCFNCLLRLAPTPCLVRFSRNNYTMSVLLFIFREQIWSGLVNHHSRRWRRCSSFSSCCGPRVLQAEMEGVRLWRALELDDWTDQPSPKHRSRLFFFVRRYSDRPKSICMVR